MKRQITFNIRPSTLAIAIVLALSGCDKLAQPTVEEHIQKAKDFEAKGDSRSGLIELKNAVAAKPQHAEARLLLGEAYLKAGEGAAAEKEFNKARELGISQELINLSLGDAWLLQKKYARILEQIIPGPSTSPKNAARIYRLRGDASLGLGQLKTGCDLYRQALRIDASNVKVHWGLARCAISENKLDEARLQLDTALKLNPKDADTWLLLGDLERLRNNVPAALSSYDNAVKAAPQNVSALVSRAATHLALGKNDLAKKDIGKAREIAPKHLDVLFMQATLDFREGRYQKANEALLQILRSASNTEVLLLFGATSHALGNFEQAAKSLGQVLAVAPGSRYARMMLASTQLRLGKPEEALTTLGPLLEAKSDDPAILSLAGQAQLQARHPDKATAYFEQAARLKPDSPAILTGLGMSRLAAGDKERALDDLEKASGMESRVGLSDNILLITYMQNGQYDQALAVIDRMEKKQPKNAYLQNLRGVVFISKKDFASARRSLEQCLVSDPTYFPAASNLASLDLMDKKPDAARGRYEAILAKDKGNVRAMLALADLATLSGKPQDAVDWLGKAVKADPKALEPQKALAAQYLRMGQPMSALPVAQGAVAAQPKDPEALDLLGQTQLAAGEKGNAVSTYKRLTDMLPQSPAAHLKLAQALAANGNPAESRKSVLKVLQLQPGHLDAQVLLASLDLGAGNYASGLKTARQIQTEHPQSAQGFLLEGDLLSAQKQFGAAAKAYEQGYSKAPTAYAFIRLHQALDRAGDAQSARARLEQWLKDHPTDTSVRVYLAQSLIQKGKVKEAATQYETVLRMEPKHTIALNDLAWLYQQANDPRALTLAEQAYKLAPKNPQVLDTLGWILLQRDDNARALQLLREAANTAPDAKGIRYHLAMALSRTGDSAGARRELQALLAKPGPFPERKEAELLLQRL